MNGRPGALLAAAILLVAAASAPAQDFELTQLADGFDEPRSGIAHGRVETLRFESGVFGTARDMIVYLPPGYDAQPDATFPLLILRHGGGWRVDDWSERGAAPVILDNLIADGRALPMIVAMPSSYMPGELGSPFGEDSIAAAAAELFEDIIPALEARYRIKPGKRYRALAGLSAGGGQSYFIGIRNQDRIGSIGVFSAGVFGGVDVAGVMARMPSRLPGAPEDFTMPSPPEPFDAQRDLGPVLDDPQGFNRRIDLFYISVGDADERLVPTSEAVGRLRASGAEIVATEQRGGHEWPVWRQALADFAPRLFR